MDYTSTIPKWSLMRINAPTLDEEDYKPFEFVNVDDGDFHCHYQLRPLFSHAGEKTIFITHHSFSLWCSNGKRYKVELYFDEEGAMPHKALTPNWGANAMIDAGRFTSKKFEYVDDNSYNQKLKTAWGSNYIYGDCICKIYTGKPLPDCSIYGDNPLSFMYREITPSRRMITKHGDEIARNMCHPHMRQEVPSGIITLEIIINSPYVKREYHWCHESTPLREMKGKWFIDEYLHSIGQRFCFNDE